MKGMLVLKLPFDGHLSDFIWPINVIVKFSQKKKVAGEREEISY
jgi:hypothetical protein